jgi:histone-lysine N-methyltransferase SETMAR
MAARDWWSHWDNAPVHTAGIAMEWMVARQFQVIKHPPSSQNLAPADFFLFPKVKRELAGLTLTQEIFKKEWEGDVGTLLAADFATAFRQWYERCKKCVDITRSYLEKS